MRCIEGETLQIYYCCIPGSISINLYENEAVWLNPELVSRPICMPNKFISCTIVKALPVPSKCGFTAFHVDWCKIMYRIISKNATLGSLLMVQVC
jgi:hypothetical protein